MILRAPGPAWSIRTLGDMTATEDERAGPSLRDADGAIHPDFVAMVSEAVQGHDAGLLSALVGELHESDTGDLIEALDPDLRPQLIELMGEDFDFTALTEVDDTVREEILEELPTETVAEGVRDLDSDDAVYDPRRPARGRSEPRSSSSCRRPSASRSHGSLDYPEESAGRRMQTEFIAVAAVLDGRPDHRLHARDRGPAGALLTRSSSSTHDQQSPRRGRRSTGCCAPSARCRCRADGRGPPRRARDRRPGRGGAPVRALQPRRGAGGRRRATGWSAC